MRLAAAILNAIVLIVFGVLFVVEVVIDGVLPSAGEFLIFLLFVGTPIFTLLTLFFLPTLAFARPNPTGRESWFSLYFKRKRAEERKKIAELEGQQHSKPPSARTGASGEGRRSP